MNRLTASHVDCFRFWDLLLWLLRPGHLSHVRRNCFTFIILNFSSPSDTNQNLAPGYKCKQEILHSTYMDEISQQGIIWLGYFYCPLINGRSTPQYLCIWTTVRIQRDKGDGGSQTHDFMSLSTNIHNFNILSWTAITSFVKPLLKQCHI